MSQESAVAHLESLRRARVGAITFTQEVLERAADHRPERLPLDTQIALAALHVSYATLLAAFPDDSRKP